MNWKTVCEFTVIGVPKGQPRPRAFARKMGDRFVARVYDAGTAEAFKGAIALYAAPHKPAVKIEGPVRVEVDFLFPRPKSLLKKKSPKGEIFHVNKPDIDNLAKAAADTLTLLGFWGDDSQISSLLSEKYYVAIDGQPGARVRVCVPAVEQSTPPTETQLELVAP